MMFQVNHVYAETWEKVGKEFLSILIQANPYSRGDVGPGDLDAGMDTGDSYRNLVLSHIKSLTKRRGIDLWKVTEEDGKIVVLVRVREGNFYGYRFNENLQLIGMGMIDAESYLAGKKWSVLTTCEDRLGR